jgi:hypothetical protein
MRIRVEDQLYTTSQKRFTSVPQGRMDGLESGRTTKTLQEEFSKITRLPQESRGHRSNGISVARLPTVIKGHTASIKFYGIH